MISIVKYIMEDTFDSNDEESSSLGSAARKQRELEKIQQDREKQPGVATKLLKKITKPVPAPPPEDHTIYTNPIKKFFNAIKQ